jgi:hypothetical protein
MYSSKTEAGWIDVGTGFDMGLRQRDCKREDHHIWWDVFFAGATYCINGTKTSLICVK